MILSLVSFGLHLLEELCDVDLEKFVVIFIVVVILDTSLCAFLPMHSNPNSSNIATLSVDFAPTYCMTG